MRRPTPLLFSLLALLALPAAASAHPERTTFFPDHTKASVPELRTSGGNVLTVCKPDSGRRVRQIWRGKGPKNTRMRKRRLRQLKACRFEHLQAAVDAAQSNDRIRVFPGVYREEPSTQVAFNDPQCSFDDPKYWEETNDGHGENGKVPTYQFHWECRNSRNLVQILGDSPEDEDLECDQKCNLQIAGMGRYAGNVLFVGDRIKKDVIRADRADGVVFYKIAIEQGSFNGLDIVETNGFRIERVVARHNQNYGILTFTTDNGLYDTIEAHNNGDSGIYPGSGPEGHCERYGIEVRNSRSYHNVLGTSGTAGNGTWYHDNKFHSNATGNVVDSFVTGHPGMPQDCSKWTDNEVYANNFNPYVADNANFCAETEFKDRERERVCPQFQGPVGTGIAIYGGNGNIVENNRIWDNWRSGFRLFWVPATIRGENDPAAQDDTSNQNRIANNVFGVTPDGKYEPNGYDVFWDEQGVGNCWANNSVFEGKSLRSDPSSLPTCEAGGSDRPVSNPVKIGSEVPCATWHPKDNPDPPGCNWFDTPPRPNP